MDTSQKPTNQTYYNVFQRDPAGAAILDQLANLFYDGFEFKTDPYQTAFNAGKREVIAYILKRCVIEKPDSGENDE